MNTPENHETRLHHPCSPSSLQNKAASPCFVGRQGTNEAAERGTLQHAVAEREEDHEDLSDEEANAVARCLEAVNELKNDLAAAGLQWIEFKEVYLPIDAEKISDPRDGSVWTGTTGGFADSCIIWPAHAKETGAAVPGTFDGAIFDWKYGRYAVLNSDENLQGKAYYLGLCRHLEAKGESLRNCTVAFLSPHRQSDPEPATFSPLDTAGIRTDVVSVVHQWFHRQKVISERTPGEWQYAEKNDVTKVFRPTDSTCVFCGNLGWCPAVRNIAVEVAHKFRPIEVPDNIYGFSENDPVSRAALLKLGDLLKAWKEDLRTRFTLDAVDDPAKIPAGYNLVATYPRKVLDPAGLRRFLVAEFGEDAVVMCEKIPLTPFEKIVRDGAARGEKTAAVEIFGKALLDAGLVEPATRPVNSLRMQ